MGAPLPQFEHCAKSELPLTAAKPNPKVIKNADLYFRSCRILHSIANLPILIHLLPPAFSRRIAQQKIR